MPKAVSYKANSIVYFKGDMNEYVYLLKSGKVDLRYNDIETGGEIRDLIRAGEFFSVKSSLGKYPKEETAMVLQDAEIIAFSVPEFEQVTMKNTRIILKMLRVFSNQLRRIHRQVLNLLSTGELVNAEKGLYHIGEYYWKRKQYVQALYAFRRYLTYYPSGHFTSQASINIQEAELRVPKGEVSRNQGHTDIAQRYFSAVKLFGQKRYSEALEEFRAISDEGSDQEYQEKASFEVGRCIFQLEDFDGCIKYCTEIVQKYPNHPNLMEILFCVGASHQKKGDSSTAGSFYNKILSLAEKKSPVFRKAQQALNALGGS